MSVSSAAAVCAAPLSAAATALVIDCGYDYLQRSTSGARSQQ